MEIAPLPFVLGWARKKMTGGNYSLRWGDFWPHSLADQDVVYAYLSPVPMAYYGARYARKWQLVAILSAIHSLFPA